MSITAGSTPDVALSKRMLGAFYTPEWVVALMVGFLDERAVGGRILEPSGGDGAFVQGLLGRGAEAKQIEVWDINEAVRTPLEALGVSVQIGDTLRTPASAPKFDAVIGNPPYLNKQSAYIKANRTWLKKRFNIIGAHDSHEFYGI